MRKAMNKLENGKLQYNIKNEKEYQYFYNRWNECESVAIDCKNSYGEECPVCNRSLKECSHAVFIFNVSKLDKENMVAYLTLK